MDDDQSADQWEWGPRQASHPIRAKDLLDGIGSEILRSLLLSDDFEEIRWSYGCSIDEARVSLACSELATLQMWDLEALVQAATVWASEEQRLSWGQEPREALRRRIALAMGVPGTPSLMSPADGVLFLRSAGVHVYFELVDAIAAMLIACDDEVAKFRELKGLPDSGFPPLTASDAQQARTSGDVAKAGPRQERESRNVPDAASVVHRTANKSDALDDLIKVVMARLAPSSSHHSIWLELMRLATSEQPPAPLLGLADGEIKWTRFTKGGETVACLNSEALRKRVRRKAHES